jgi:hypothetical protein
MSGRQLPVPRHAMLNDNTDPNDLNRLADDGCPNTTGDTQVHDLSQVLAALAKNKG